MGHGSQWTSTITLPITHKQYKIIALCNFSNNAHTAGQELVSYSQTVTKFSLHLYNRNNSTTIDSTIGIHWFTIGT